MRIPLLIPTRVALHHALARPPAPVRRGSFAREPTPADMLGPAYREGAPFRSELCSAEEPGQPLVVEGRILDARTGAALVGTRVEAWQTNARGLYSDLLGLAPEGDARRMNFRGQLFSGPDGRWRVMTRLPGHYPLGPLTRPRHIHLRVRHEGHAELVTQLYFEGDPWLGRRQHRRPGLIVSPVPSSPPEGRTVLRAELDLVLAPR